jgi:AcrR family transcriptional regulator
MATRPPTRRRRANGESRRDELLQIAMRVFAEKGIAGATVRDIAQEAGILSGSLYHHFASKEEMVKEIVGDGPSGDPDVHHEIIAAASGPVEAVHDCILHAVDWVAENPHRARIFRNDAQYIEETPALAESEEKRRSIHLIWLTLVEQGVADGVFRRDVDADLTVRAMWDGILGSTRWFPPLGDSDPGYVGAQLAAFYLAGLRRPGAPVRRPRGPRSAAR